MNKLQQIKEKIWEAVPSIKDLTFGCVIFEDKTHKEIYLGKDPENYESWFFEEDLVQGMDSAYSLDTDEYKPKNGVIGRDIRLSDVLVAIGKIVNVYIDEHGNFHNGDCSPFVGSGKVVRWNLLKDNLDDQSEETISFIHSLLIKE